MSPVLSLFQNRLPLSYRLLDGLFLAVLVVVFSFVPGFLFLVGVLLFFRYPKTSKVYGFPLEGFAFSIRRQSAHEIRRDVFFAFAVFQVDVILGQRHRPAS